MARRGSTPEVDRSLRFWGGVNRVEDARLGDPAAPWATVNKYGRSPGVLAPRPGSKLITDGTATTQDAGGSLFSVADATRAVVANLGSGESLLRLHPAVFSAVNAESLGDKRGIYKRTPAVLSAEIPLALLPKTVANLTTIRLGRVAGLHRLYMDEGTKRYWVAAWNTEAGDRLGYLDSSNAVKLINFDGITSMGANFFFTPYRYRHDDATSDQGYFALATNQLNQPIALKDGTSLGTGVFATTLSVCSSEDWGGDTGNDTPGTDALADSVERLFRARAMCVYNGVVVYAGYRMAARTAGSTVKNFDNYVAFADLGMPHRLAFNDGLVSNLRVGDTEAEACTACTTSVFETDQIGAQNQLIVFTERRIWTFNGTPPQSGVPIGGNFVANMNDIVGCVAPRSVVQTPHGVMFLGTDGLIYIIPKGSKGNIIPISQKIQPVFRNLTLEQQSNVAAFWDRDGYYKIIMPGSQEAKADYKKDVRGANQKFKGLTHAIPEVGWYADMRHLKMDPENDMGVRWDGPMEGQKHSCFAQAWGSEDRGEIYAGSAVDGCIIEINRFDLASDPQPGSPTKVKEFECYVVTGALDEGDAHWDKTVTALSLGVCTDRRVNIRTNLIVSGPSVNDEQGEVFDEIIKPAGPVLGVSTQTGGTPIILGATKLSPPDNVAFYSEQPGRILMGKTFRAEIRERNAFEIREDDLGSGTGLVNKALNFVANSVNYTASVTPGIYTGLELAAAVQVAMRAQVGGSTITVTYTEPQAVANDGKFTIAYSGAGNFQLLFATGANASEDCNLLLGFNATDHTGAVTYTSDFRPMDSYRARVALSDLKFTYIPSGRRSP